MYNYFLVDANIVLHTLCILLSKVSCVRSVDMLTELLTVANILAHFVQFMFNQSSLDI